MKKDNVPLIVAIFLVMGGLLSGAFVFGNNGGETQVTPSRGSGFFISAARGAEGATMFLGIQVPSPITAVSNNSELNTKSVFSNTLGAVKDIGTLGLVQSSSLSR
jgi:hypothetical protein